MTGKPQPRPFPMAALLEASERIVEDNQFARGLSKLARAVDIHPAAMTRAWHSNDGMLTVRQADEWAVRMGFHPWEIWGDQWLDPEAYEEGARA